MGLTEAQARAEGYEVVMGRQEFEGGKARAIGSTIGLVKSVVDAATDRILGCHIAGPDAGNLVHEAVIAMVAGATYADIGRAIPVHPTLAEGVNSPRRRVHRPAREADLAGLDLDAAGVDWGPRGVSVAGHLQSTTNPAVYAAGDSADTPGMPLTPVAVFEGNVASSNMVNRTTRTPDYAGVPTAVFIIPELARVGMLEQQASKRGLDIDVRYSNTSGWYSNYRIGETTAAAKILVDRTTDQVVGAHLLGPECTELINILGLAMKLRLTTRQLKSMTAAYPTVGSDLGSML